MKLLLLAVLCLNANAALLTFTDEASWTWAMAGKQIVTETFTGALLPTTGVVQVGGPAGFILNDQWRDATLSNAGATPPNTPLKTTAFSYLPSAFLWGFGFNLSTAPGQPNGQGGHASGVTVTVAGQMLANLRNYNGEFFGVVATTEADRFSSILLGTPQSCADGSPACTGWEIFDLDNLRFAVDHPTSNVPEPATFILMGSALAVLLMSALIRRRR